VIQPTTAPPIDAPEEPPRAAPAAPLVIRDIKSIVNPPKKSIKTNE